MNPIPDSDLQARIEQLWIHPVKSCAGLAVDEAVLTAAGLEWDRAWMVVDGEGEFVTQRELPRMALIQPSFRLDQLVLRAPGMLALHLSLDGVEFPRRVRVWSDEVDAWDMGDLAAQWFSDFLGTEAPEGLKRLRLVRFDPEVKRLCSAKWTGGRESVTQFADGFAVLVTSTASLDELNQRLTRAGQTPVDMRRFRPNVVLGGVESADEDRIGAWRVHTPEGVAALENVKPCARCPIPNIDPSTAESSPAVGDALQGFRQDPRLDGAITFGMNAIVLQGEGLVLRVGQPVTADWIFD
ncbi:MAG: MOSC N-terminal beta barrel domain-containing protein [Hydrogenophaga sp.]|nr:MOSC N-terminal beta barrel domain-containing protein [Hydrogenophaga sp.]